MASVQGYPDSDDLMETYQADYQIDVDLKGLDASLTAGAREVMKKSDGLNRLKQSTLYLGNSIKKTEGTLMCVLKEIYGAKGQEATAIEKLLDQFLIKQYFENSKLTLELCEVQLLDFIGKADKVAKCIKEVVDKADKRNRKKLRTAENNYHCSAKEIVAKIVSLHDRHVNLLNQLNSEFKRLDKKLKLIRTVKKMVHVIFIGVLCAVFACSVMAAAMTVPGVAAAMTSHPGVAAFIAASAIAQASSPAINEGHRWLLTMLRESESTHQPRQDLIASMQSGTMDAIKVLDDIMSHVEKVIASEKSCNLISSDLDEKMEKFQEEIEDLKKTGEECIRVIKKARKEVSKEYDSLKKAL